MTKTYVARLKYIYISVNDFYFTFYKFLLFYMILKETLLIIREIQVIHKKVISEQCTKCVCLPLLSGHSQNSSRSCSQSTNQICLHCLTKAKSAPTPRKKERES